MNKLTFGIVVFFTLSTTPALADEQDDIAFAERLLAATELGSASADAAMKRADAALVAAMVAAMSRPADTRAMRGIQYTFESCFREFCRQERNWRPADAERYKTDEQLESQGCYTRTQANWERCGMSHRTCEEPVPESVGQIPPEDFDMHCMTGSPWTKSIHDSLYDLFFDEEVEKRLEDVDPKEREAIRSQIAPTDV